MRVIRNCTVLVFGGAGFLGSHLVNHLIDDRHCEVYVVDNLRSGQLKHVHPKAHFIKWDICNGETVGLFKHLHQCQYVFNYAAEPYIPECFDDPSRFFSVNAVGVLTILNMCEKARVEGVLQVSSAEIYGDSTGRITEEAVITPHSTYGVSKLAADGLVQVRWRERGVPGIALRQFNCIGERETHEYVVPEIISQLHKGPTVRLGNNSTRDFLYAGDAVRMAVELLEQGKFGQVYNMGSEECITIYTLAKLIGTLMGHPHVEIVVDERRARPWEIWHLQSDNAKLYSAITIRPKTDLREALRLTIEYFRQNGNKWDW